MSSTNTLVDLTPFVLGARERPFRPAPAARRLRGSAILKVAAEIRSRMSVGERICNLTVGDFDPRQFPVPEVLAAATADGLQHGETNYPPSLGMPALRQAVVATFERELGLRYPVESVLVTSGSRPGVYGAYRTLVGEGDRVVFGAPSWNNDYYCDMVGATQVPIPCGPEGHFLPSPDSVARVIRGARLVALNSPLNPCGTAFTAEALGGICDVVLEENARRSAEEGPVYLLYDQVYRLLTFEGTSHVDPVSLRPEMARYTVFVDGISKAFAATGLRVGWVVAPTDVVSVMNNILQHVGTWAPRAEQLGTARVLGMTAELEAFREGMVAGLRRRLELLHRGICQMRDAGCPVDAIEPSGAIYLSAKFDLVGRRTTDGGTIQTAEDVRAWLLRSAGLAVVPFDAFGASSLMGWCRLSVGAVSVEAIEAALPRLRAGLDSLQ
jgi:aspartate aminotransferase